MGNYSESNHPTTFEMAQQLLGHPYEQISEVCKAVSGAFSALLKVQPFELCLQPFDRRTL